MDPHLIHDSLDPSKPVTQMASRSVQPFCTDDRIVSLYFTMGRPPPQNCPLPWKIWTPSNTWFPGPTRVLNQNGNSIGSTIIAGLTNVHYSVSNNRLRNTAMRPNNKNNRDYFLCLLRVQVDVRQCCPWNRIHSLIQSATALLWPPCVADADIIFSSCGFFYLSSFFCCFFLA